MPSIKMTYRRAVEVKSTGQVVVRRTVRGWPCECGEFVRVIYTDVQLKSSACTECWSKKKVYPAVFRYDKRYLR